MPNRIFPTKAEQTLARALKKARFNFVQNIFIKGFEIDFLVEDKVVVEVDGFVHVISSNIARDRRKDKVLEEAGYTVIRFTNDDCYYDIKRCVKSIKYAVEQNKLIFKMLNDNYKERQPWQIKLSRWQASL